MASDPEMMAGPGERAGPLDWLAAFQFAVVRLATFVGGSGSAPGLVFASVEMLAPDRPRPVSGPVQRSKVPDLGREARVFVRRTAMGAGDALAWFVEAGAGRLVTPHALDPGPDGGETDGVQVAAATLVHEPEWPDFALPLDRDPFLDPRGGGSYAPFVGAGAESARINRLVAPPEPRLEALLADPTANAFLRRRLHVDLALYPEYRGGAVLFAPDPVVRSVQMFVRPRKGGKDRDEDLVVRVKGRDGAALDGLALTVQEVRGGGLTRFETVEVPPDGLLAFPRRNGAAKAGYVLVHRRRGIVRHQPPLPFLRQANVGMRVLERKVEVEAPTSESPKAGMETYATDEYSAREPLVIGEVTGGDASSRIRAAEATRERMAAADRQGQRWLDDAGQARVLVREILSRASRHVWLADPYLGGNQIFQYLHAVGALSVEIRLLTSRLAFQAEAEADDPGVVPKGGERDKLVRFERGLRSLRFRGFSNVRASTLRGKSPRLHDRFLVVDGEVWFAGSSLNALGARAGLILKVPDPAPVIARLRALEAEATPFADFLRDRARATRAGGGVAT